MLIRYLLEKCKTTDESIKELNRIPISSAQTITIADKIGDIAVVECNPENIDVIRPKNSEQFVATANNFNSIEMKKYRNPEVDDWRSDERYDTASNALQNNTDIYSVKFADLRKISE